MVFNLFRVKIIVRLILLIAVFLAFAYFVQKPFYYFTSIELLIVAILLIVELVYFVEKGYRQLNNMLQSVKEKDFNMSFSQVEQSKTLSNLALLLNDLSEAYRQVRIEKEVHYQFLNHIVDQVNQVMVCFDSDGNVTLSNSAAKKVLAVNSIFNVSSFSKIDPSLPKKLLNIREGQERLLSLFYNGEMLKYVLSCSSIKLLDKKLKLVVLHDIRNPLQEQEQDSYRKLIRVLTHEIMNSVTPILSLSQAMSDNLRVDETTFRPLGELTAQESVDLVEGYQAIEIRSRALMRFVNDFKSISKLPSPKFQKIDVEDMLKGLITLQKSTIENQGVEMIFTQDPGVKTIFADKDLIEQVLLNLIKNAIEATETSDSPKVDISVYSQNSMHIISVIDNGTGISTENFDKVFIPFFSTKREGSGIGLSLSREIMRLHGGSITVKSEEGKGASFSILLPICKN